MKAPFPPQSILVDEPDSDGSQIDSRSHASKASAKSKKSVQFDGSANEKHSQTDASKTGMVVPFQEWKWYSECIALHKAAQNLTIRKREAKAAEKHFYNLKRNIKAFKDLTTDTEWIINSILTKYDLIMDRRRWYAIIIGLIYFAQLNIKHSNLK